MTSRSRCAAIFLVITGFGEIAYAAPAVAPTACGIRSLPLAVGNTWTYKSGAATVTIAILNVAPGKTITGTAATEIKVKELYGDRIVATTWTCTPGDGLTIPPESFFFSGEPGGATSGAFQVLTHQNATLPADGSLVLGATWVEKITADAVRGDASGEGLTHLPGKVELERHVTIGTVENLAMEVGQFAAQKVSFELRGRSLVEDQRYEFPVKRPGAIWIARGLGVVKIDDPFDKTWELISTNATRR